MMSLAVLVGREPPSNAVSAAAGRKNAKAPDEKSPDFKDFVHHHSHGNHADKAKADKADNTDGKAEKGGDDDQPAWRGIGLHFGRVDATAEDRGEKTADGDEQLATDEDGAGKTDVTASGAALAADAGIVLPAAQAAGKAVAKTTDRNAAATPLDETPQIAAGGDAEIAADAEAPVKPAQIAATATVAAQSNVANPDAKQPGSITAPARAPSGENVQNSAQPAAAKAAQEADTGNADPKSGGDNGKGREQQPQAAIPTPGGGRTAGVTVLSQQVAPAPVAAVQSAPISDTGAAFVKALAPQVPGGEKAEAAANATLAQNAGKLTPITTLRIQLHPAELGLVTAKLSGTHAQLSIEISVNNAEARHRLTSDSDSIVTALKNMGINVDRVTVQHTQAGTGATPNNAGRGGEFAQSGESRGENQGQSSRQGSERNDGGNPRAAQRGDKPEVAGGGVYI